MIGVQTVSFSTTMKSFNVHHKVAH